MNIQVALIAGGKATRLGTLTRDLPKSMVEVRGKPFISYQLEMLQSAGVDEIVLCLGYLADSVIRYVDSIKNNALSITYSIENQPLDTAGALLHAAPYLQDTFFTLYGDSYLFLNFKDLLQYFRAQHKLGLMTVYKNSNRYDRSNTSVEDNLVSAYDKDSPAPDMHYIEYGANILDKKALDFVPTGEPFPLGSLFKKLISMRQLLAYEVRQRFYEIGSLTGLKDFKHYAGQKL